MTEEQTLVSTKKLGWLIIINAITIGIVIGALLF